MTIRKEGLLYRWYHEWELRGGSRPPVMNLCYFVRVLVLWGPVRFLLAPKKSGWLLQVPPVLWAIAAFLACYIGVEIWNDWTPLLAFVVVTLALGSLGGLLWLLVTGVARAHDLLAEPLHVYRNYRAARHNRICPLIEVK